MRLAANGALYVDDMTNGETVHAVIATFDSSAQAEQAANDLMDWDKNNNPQINLGAAILVMCSDPEVKAITDYLKLEGGRTMSHSVDAAGLEDSANAAQAAQAPEGR
jgi:hypothetical protein